MGTIQQPDSAPGVQSPRVAAAFVGLIIGHTILKNLQVLALFPTEGFRNSALKRQISSMQIFLLFSFCC